MYVLENNGFITFLLWGSTPKQKLFPHGFVIVNFLRSKVYQLTGFSTRLLYFVIFSVSIHCCPGMSIRYSF